MEQKDFDIYEILKDVEYGTGLYTPMCGKVVLTCLTSSNEMIRTDKYTRIYRFDKNGRWEKKEKEAMEQPDFKPFGKVLARDGKGYEWLPALFVRDRGDGANYRCKVLPLRSGKSSECSCCIPFEGNEQLAFTDEDFKDLPF